MANERADSGAGTGFAAGVSDFGAENRAQSRFDKCPRAHVLRLFLTPDELRTFRKWLEDFAQSFFCKWVKLLYANDRLWPIAFATAAAIGSKTIFRARVGKGTRHFYNPSNFGISLTLILFSWVGIAPPYHFVENLDRFGDWALPAIIIVTGSFLNARFTRRLPLIIAWLTGFFAQAAARSFLFGTPLVAGLLPMTGMAFILYTFYMVTDPATTPQGRASQVAFGTGVAATYGALLLMHIVFGLFFALTIVCTVRGLGLYAQAWATSRARAKIITVRVPIVAKAEP